VTREQALRAVAPLGDGAAARGCAGRRGEARSAAMSPLFIVGAGLFFTGGAAFMGALFSSGGGAKSQQFRVIGELWRGEHGAGKRRLAKLGLLAVVAGAITLFAGVAAQDAERARRCEARCEAAGMRGKIGPSSQPHPTKKGAAAFVACVCEGPDGARQESRADEPMR
jgi:hypothetical protein